MEKGPSVETISRRDRTVDRHTQHQFLDVTLTTPHPSPIKPKTQLGKGQFSVGLFHRDDMPQTIEAGEVKAFE